MKSCHGYDFLSVKEIEYPYSFRRIFCAQNFGGEFGYWMRIRLDALMVS